jgi:hypothetical protein
VAGAEPATGPFSDLPLSHGAYRSVAGLAETGIFTGYPPGTFNGKRALTRYEFAVALQRMLQEIQRPIAAIPAPGASSVHTLQLVELRKLTREFGSELAMLGVDVQLLERNLAALAAKWKKTDPPWKHPAPDLALVEADVYPGGGSVSDPAYALGHWQAVSEWRRGEAVFYTTTLSGPGLSVSTGLAYRPVDGKPDDPSTLALIAGHNAELRRRLRTTGPPKGARRVSAHFDLTLAWRPLAPDARRQLEKIALADASPAPGPQRLSLQQPEATSPDGRTLLRLEDRGRGGIVLRIARSERTVEWPLAHLTPSTADLSVRWGDPQHDLLFLRTGLAGKPEPTALLELIDLRSGASLLHEEVAERWVNTPYNPFAISKVNPFIDGSDR